MNRDYAEILSALCAEEAEFLVVGAHAMAAHGFPRATGDLDIWIRPASDNAVRVWRALRAFGVPLDSLGERDFETPGTLVQIGEVPCCIEIMTAIDGVDFESAWKQRSPVLVGQRTIFVLGLSDLVAHKRAAGRPKDLADLVMIEPTPER